MLLCSNRFVSLRFFVPFCDSNWHLVTDENKNYPLKYPAICTPPQIHLHHQIRSLITYCLKSKNYIKNSVIPVNQNKIMNLIRNGMKYTSTTLSSFSIAGSISMNSLIYVRGCHAKICIGVYTHKKIFFYIMKTALK